MTFIIRHPALLPAVPLAFAALCPLVGSWRRKLAFPWALTGATLTAAALWLAAVRLSADRPVTYDLGGWVPPWGIRLRLDVMGLTVACTVSLLTALAVLFSYRGLDGGISESRIPYFYTLVLLSLGAMVGFCLTEDLFSMFLLVEVFCLAACGLLALEGGSGSLQPTFGYLLASVSAGAGFLLALGLLYSVTGALDLGKLSIRLSSMESKYVPVAAVGLALMLLALLVKQAVVPLHYWFVGAGNAASAEPGVMLVLVPAVCALAMTRILHIACVPAFSGSAGWDAGLKVLAWFGALAMVTAAALALTSDGLKRMSLLMGVSQMGLIVLALGSRGYNASAGAVYLVPAAAGGMACLLMVERLLGGEDPGRKFAALRGAGRRRPVTGAVALVAALCLAGVPLTAGYTGRRLTGVTLAAGGQYALMALMSLGSVLLLACAVRLGSVLFGRPGGGAVAREHHWTRSAPPVAVSAGLVLLGIAGPWLGAAMVEAAAAMNGR